MFSSVVGAGKQELSHTTLFTYIHYLLPKNLYEGKKYLFLKLVVFEWVSMGYTYGVSNGYTLEKHETKYFRMLTAVSCELCT